MIYVEIALSLAAGERIGDKLKMNIIKSTRIEKGITVNHISRELGMSILEYLFYEKRVYLMPASKGYKLCQLLNIDFNNL